MPEAMHHEQEYDRDEDQAPSRLTVEQECEMDEDQAWSRLTMEQFFAGYGEIDAVYDQV